MILSRFKSDKRGATAVEFALICFPLVLIFFGCFEFARALQANNNLSYAAGLASRAILTNNAISEADLSRTIRGAFVGGDEEHIEITYGTEIADGVTFRTMTVSYPFHFVVSAVSEAPITLSVSRRVPTE